MGEPLPACRAGLTRISRRHRTLRDQWCDSRKAVGEQIEERLVRELRGSEDVGHPLAVGEDIDCRDGPLLGAGDQLLDTAPLEDDEAEALGDVAAQALRPRLRPSAVQLITERVRRGRSVAAGDQRRHDREPVGEQLAELAVDEVRRAEDVGEVDALMQGVEGSSKRARAILGQPRSTIDLRRTILDGGILFVSTAQGTAGRDVAALVGSSILNLVDAVIREQGDLPPERRRGALVVVDEMQSMPGVDYESMLSELGKFGASFVLATQSLDKLDDLSHTAGGGDIAAGERVPAPRAGPLVREWRRGRSGARRISCCYANVGCLAIFQVAGSDARQLVWELDRDRISEEDIVSLPVHHCYVRGHRGNGAHARLLHEGAQAGGRRCRRRRRHPRRGGASYLVTEEEIAARRAEGRRRVEEYRKGLEALHSGEAPPPHRKDAAPDEPARGKSRSKHFQPPTETSSEDEGVRPGRDLPAARARGRQVVTIPQAAIPFLDRLEMVALSGWSRGAVWREHPRAGGGGACRLPLPRLGTRRPDAPLRPHRGRPAPSRQRGGHGDARAAAHTGRLLVGQAAHWRRLLLLERLDAVAVVYRLAAGIADLHYPIRFRWYRAMPMDAAIALPDGRTLAVVRQGNTADRTAFAKRLWRLGSREGPRPGAYLLLAPDARCASVRRAG